MGHVARMVDKRGLYRVLVGKPRHIWEDNIKIDLQELVCGSVDWIELVPVRDSIKCGEFLD